MTIERLDRRLGLVVETLRGGTPRPAHGRLTRAVGTVLRAALPDGPVGSVWRLNGAGGPLLAEIVGLDGDEAVLAPIGDIRGLALGAELMPVASRLQVPVGPGLLGRVLNGLGEPLDAAQRGPLPPGPTRACRVAPPPPLQRRMVEQALPVGIRVIDALLTCGEGQRVGIYGEPGGGKSTLLGSLVRGAAVDAVVIALVGERGREVRDFLERQIDETARRRAVCFVATSDRPPAERLAAAYAATTAAEAFRDEGKRVLLVMDSITRVARAMREIGLAAGEPPTRRGFPPSVMAELPRLLERTGPGAIGSITAFYTVLVEGDGSGDPIAEETRGILDGHIVLSPRIAAANRYPAIDVLASRSRVMEAVAMPGHRAAAAAVREIIHRHSEIEFLVQVGQYERGVDVRNDAALDRIEAVRGFLRQDAREQAAFTATVAQLQALPVG